MKIIIENTTKIVELNGIHARVWEGKTETGINVFCFISRIAIDKNETQENKQQFENELIECKEPSEELESIPLRLII